MTQDAPDFDLDDIMEKIRAEVNRRRGNSNVGTATPAASRRPALGMDLNHLNSMVNQAGSVAEIGAEVPPFQALPSVLRPFARLITRALYALLQIITVDQRVFNKLALNSLRLTGATLRDLTEAAKDTESQIAAMTERTESQIAAMTERTACLEQGLESERRAHARAQAQLRAAIAQHGGQLANLLAEVGKRLPEPLDRSQITKMAAEEQHLLDALYFSIEDRFRGEREDIKERVRIYLPYIQAARTGAEQAHLLDLGCGRGEWLELLRDEGIPASGIDQSRLFVGQCRERGLDVTQGDAIACLRKQPEGGLGAITAFHLIEHLPFEMVIALLDESIRTLRPGGLVILETPNPANVLVGSCNFYLDPTHRNPLPSPIVRFLAESRGFADVEILELHPPAQDMELGESALAQLFRKHFLAPQDYAVLGRRP